MKTYNFIVYDKQGKSQMIEVNACSEEEAWRQLLGLPIEITYIGLI